MLRKDRLILSFRLLKPMTLVAYNQALQWMRFGRVNDPYGEFFLDDVSPYCGILEYLFLTPCSIERIKKRVNTIFS